MKKLYISLLTTALCLGLNIADAQANNALDYYDSLRAKTYEAERQRFDSYHRIKPLSGNNNSFDNSSYDRRYNSLYKKEKSETGTLKSHRAPKSQQYDTWGRNGSQHKSSLEILQDMISPAKKQK